MPPLAYLPGRNRYAPINSNCIVTHVRPSVKNGARDSVFPIPGFWPGMRDLSRRQRVVYATDLPVNHTSGGLKSGPRRARRGENVQTPNETGLAKSPPPLIDSVPPTPPTPQQS